MASVLIMWRHIFQCNRITVIESFDLIPSSRPNRTLADFLILKSHHFHQ